MAAWRPLKGSVLQKGKGLVQPRWQTLAEGDRWAGGWGTDRTLLEEVMEVGCEPRRPGA